MHVETHAWGEPGPDEGGEVLARVIETGQDGLMVLSTGGHVAYLSGAAERLLGISADAAIGRLFEDLPLWYLTPDGRQLAVEDRPSARAFRTGKPVSGEQAIWEKRDGQRVGLLVEAVPVVDSNGEVSSVVVTLRDEAARRGAEAAFREQAATLHAQAELLDLAHDAIFTRDLRSSTIEYWSRGAEELYGFSRVEALGKVSHELLASQFPQPLDEIEETMLRTGHWEGEIVQRTLDGHEVVVESRWALQRNAVGDPVAFLEVNRDVTIRKRAEAELAQRLKELTLRNREMAAVNSSVAAISRALDLPQVLQDIVDAARELLSARYAALGVADGRGRITAFITSGITPEQRAAIGPLPQGHGLLGALIREGEPLRVPRIAADPRSHGFPPNHPPMTSLLGVPILARGKALGDLYLTDKIGAEEFSQDDEALLTILAGHAAVAIEKAQLYEDVLAARDQLRAWNRDLEAVVAERTREVERMSREMTTRVLQAQEDERARIARELHDETAQSLARLLIDLDLLKPHLAESEGPVASGLARLGQLLQGTLDEVRALSHDLRPTILDDIGLVAAIRSIADDWTRTFGVPIEVDTDEMPDRRLPPDMEVALFRITQEALMNAGKYARASFVRVDLSVGNESIVLSVQDDGIGFDPDHLESPTRRGGLGVYGMRERTTLLGGTLTIDSEPGKGTRVTLAAPLT